MYVQPQIYFLMIICMIDAIKSIPKFFCTSTEWREGGLSSVLELPGLSGPYHVMNELDLGRALSGDRDW